MTASASELRAPRVAFPAMTDGFDEATATGDLNGDGHVDIVARRSPPLLSGPDGVVALLGDGGGNFTLGVPTTIGPVGTTNWDARVLADVTGDGLLDVVVARHPLDTTDTSAWLVMRGDGLGGFEAPIELHVTGTARDVAATDANGDGTLDVVGVHTIGFTESAVQVWTWTGSSFAEGTPLLLPEACETLAVADIDGNGTPEAFTTPRSGPTLYQVELSALPSTVRTYAIQAAVSDRRVSTGDVDGDGFDDVLVSARGSNGTIPFAHLRLQLLLGDGSDLLVQQPAQSVTSTSAYDGRLVDWDGDGRLELLSQEILSVGFADVTFLRLVSLNEQNTFELAATVMTKWVRYTESAPPLPADVDGDGHLDLIAANTVFAGRSVFEDSPKPSPLAQDFSLRAAVDVEGDGDVDLVGNAATIYRNDGTGVLTPEALATTPPGEEYGWTMGVDDFDGDGVRDLLSWYGKFNGTFVTFDSVRLLRGQPGGDFVDSGLAAPKGILPGWIGGVSPFGSPDVDGDGDPDLIDSEGWWENDGTGFFTMRHDVGRPIRGAGDVDDDGDVDFVAFINEFANRRFVLLRNEGTAGFTEEFLVSGSASTGTLVPFFDNDGDGDLDLAVTSGNPTLGEQGLYLFENVGGTLQSPSFFPGPKLDWLTPSDLDGDGDLDLLSYEFTEDTPRSIYTWEQTAPWVFDEAVEYFGPPAGNAFDADGDGDLDLVGYFMTENGLYEGDADGRIRQYGKGFADPGTVEPILGAAGPLRPGSATAELRLVRGPELGLMILVLSADSASIDLDGLPIWVGNSLVQVTRLLVGEPGVPGSSSFTFALENALPDLAGAVLYHQAFVIDPATASSFSATAGLELTYGD